MNRQIMVDVLFIVFGLAELSRPFWQPRMDANWWRQIRILRSPAVTEKQAKIFLFIVGGLLTAVGAGSLAVHLIH